MSSRTMRRNVTGPVATFGSFVLSLVGSAERLSISLLLAFLACAVVPDETNISPRDIQTKDYRSHIAMGFKPTIAW